MRLPRPDRRSASCISRMHLQQTKSGSRETGGPQYHFHDVPPVIKEYLRKKGACEVVLQTPYVIAGSPFMAVSRDHKLTSSGKATRGSVGHDRIQQAKADESIGESIRHWYGLPAESDFERIDVDVNIHKEGHFILIPISAKLRGKKREIPIERPVFPLSFTKRIQSPLWKRHVEDRLKGRREESLWIREEIFRVVHSYQNRIPHLLECDLLRSGGALSRLGLKLGPYVGKSYDCDPGIFQFFNLPEYSCPVEIKKRSRDFQYQILKYKPLPRAVVLCVEDDFVNPPEHIDVLELDAVYDHLSRFVG